MVKVMLLVEQTGLDPADLVTLTSATFSGVQVGPLTTGGPGSVVPKEGMPVALTKP